MRIVSDPAMLSASFPNPMSLEPIVKLDNANIYQQKNLVLSQVSLQIDKGEFVYLIGKTGSGKSSLLKILYGDAHLNQGDGNVGGFHLHDLKEKQVPFLRRKLGIVFQDFQLLTDRSVNANLYFVLKATGWKDKVLMQQRIQEVLEKVGLGTKGFKMPHELSGGEQQRVAIARALLNDPDLILADEPTGNLDPGTSEEIMKLLLDISSSGRAVLMATHNYSIMEKFPARIIKCENGRLVDSKTTAS
jgi:cell division transport system ATP-binding protein